MNIERKDSNLSELSTFSTDRTERNVFSPISISRIELSPEDRLIKELGSLLNKIATPNYDRVSLKIINLLKGNNEVKGVDDFQTMKRVVELFFKVSTESIMSDNVIDRPCMHISKIIKHLYSFTWVVEEDNTRPSLNDERYILNSNSEIIVKSDLLKTYINEEYLLRLAENRTGTISKINELLDYNDKTEKEVKYTNKTVLFFEFMSHLYINGFYFKDTITAMLDTLISSFNKEKTILEFKCISAIMKITFDKFTEMVKKNNKFSNTYIQILNKYKTFLTTLLNDDDTDDIIIYGCERLIEYWNDNWN